MTAVWVTPLERSIAGGQAQMQTTLARAIAPAALIDTIDAGLQSGVAWGPTPNVID